jgi:hypothetical protein
MIIVAPTKYVDNHVKRTSLQMTMLMSRVMIHLPTIGAKARSADASKCHVHFFITPPLCITRFSMQSEIPFSTTQIIHIGEAVELMSRMTMPVS